MQKRGRVVSCPDFWLPAAKSRIPVAGFPVLLHNGASLLVIFPSLPIVEVSLLVDIAFLLSREPIFLAGQYYFQQDKNNSNRTGRTGKLSAGRQKIQIIVWQTKKLRTGKMPDQTIFYFLLF